MSTVPSAPTHRRVELAIDRVLDQRYRVLQPLGAGGSSQVYLAQDDALGREVAIKILDPEAARDNELRRRFVKEARALAQLSHPNIVPVYDVGEVDGLPFIVMEKLEVSLKSIIDRRGALEIDEAARIASEIAAGLAAAHARGIVHADLKPANILFDQHGRAKIADFGIARTPQDSAESPQIFATALYVAPERVEGRPATAASDIYGLGLVLYEMLVGKPPFTSSNAAVLLRDHVVRPPIPPSHLRPSLPKELDTVVLKALAKDPGLRFARPLDLARALSRIEGLDDVLAPVRVREDTGPIMTAPLEGLLPYRTESPVVAMLARHAVPIRRAFYTLLTVAPLWALLSLAGVPPAYIALFSGVPAIIALAGHLGIAFAVAWIVESLVIFLFLPPLAVIFVVLGLWLAIRDYSVEQAAIALAGPVLAPLGLAPGVVLAAASLHGLGGILAVAWGGVMAVAVAVIQGAPTSAPFVVSGLLFDQPNLLETPRALAARQAFADVLRAGQPLDERLQPLAALFDPKLLWDQVVALVSRLAGADLSAAAGTVAAWVLAATMVWVVTRLIRLVIDAAFRPKRWFSVYILATALGVLGGALFLFGAFSTWRPLAESPNQFSDGVLLLSALTGAVFSLAATAVIGATRPLDRTDEAITHMVTAPHVLAH